MESHDNKEIISVCINPNCVNPRLCCRDCVSTLHSSHINDLEKLSNLPSLFEQKYQIIVKLKNWMDLLISSSKILEDVLNELNFQENIQIHKLSYCELQNQLKKIITLSQTDIQFVKKIDQNIQILPILKNKLQELKQYYEISKSQINLHSIAHRFSLEYKHSDIRINDDRRIASNQGFSGFVIAEPLLSPLGVSQYKFKILEKGKSLAIGVCLKEKVSQSNFEPNLWDDIGHGTYLITCSGQCFSHHDREVNNQQRSFTFNNNDIILVTLDMNQMIIKWEKLNSNKNFQLEIRLNKQCELYAGAQLFGGSSIEILSILDPNH